MAVRRAVFSVALLVAACGGSVTAHWTEYGKRMRLPEKPANCPLHVVHDERGMYPHYPVAKMTFSDPNGMTAAGEEDAELELRAQTCALGGDGYIVDYERYSTPFVGTKVEATAFVWARPVPYPPPPPPAPPAAPIGDAGSD